MDTPKVQKLKEQIECEYKNLEVLADVHKLERKKQGEA